MNKFALAIDCGTHCVRAIIFDDEGNVVCRKEKVFNDYYSSEFGWKEAPASMFWDDLCTVTKEMNEDRPDLVSQLIGVTVSCQRDTGTVVDEKGEALRDFISWMDRREIDKPFDIPPLWYLLFTLVGKKGFVDSFNVSTHAHWMRKHEPEIWNKSDHFALLSTYYHGKLTGKSIDTISNIAGHLPFNFKKKRWCKNNEIVNQVIRIEPEKRPMLIPSCEIIGYITDVASEQTGLPEGLPVISSGTDKGCETIGVGCLSSDTASISLGTQATVETTTRKYYELVKFYPSLPSVLPEGYNPEIIIYNGWWMYNWFIKTYCEWDVEYCRQNNLSIYDYLEDKLKQTNAGADGLVLQPFWGMESFRPEAKGSIIGFTEGQDKFSILRAIVEGLGYALREGIEKIERKSGEKIYQIALSGGGSNNSCCCEILASILGKEVYLVQTPDTTGLGAAMAVFTATGIYSDLYEAREHMVHEKKRFYPDESLTPLYDVIYNQVYIRAYKQYKPLYQALDRIKRNRGEK